MAQQDKSRDKREQGLFGKFVVRRVDGRDGAGEKHDLCQYFVLDLTHDPHAIPAIRAYADSAEKDGYIPLAKELRFLADGCEAALKATSRTTIVIGEKGGRSARLTQFPEYGMWCAKYQGELCCAPMMADGSAPSLEELGSIEDWHGIKDEHRKEIEALQEIPCERCGALRALASEHASQEAIEFYEETGHFASCDDAPQRSRR